VSAPPLAAEINICARPVGSKRNFGLTLMCKVGLSGGSYRRAWLPA
jgi:hypothetical protein